MPVSSAARAGVQDGVELYARAKWKPPAASRSRCGVWITGFPATPRQSPRIWSAIRNRMFGFLAGAEGAAPKAGRTAAAATAAPARPMNCLREIPPRPLGMTVSSM